ncbi:MAG TPA: DUF1697 domain-containing protein [Acidimicrobiia bacterium]|nr:DUF1697 domain-containing protein [Acidimicrobiia bacterium]
MTEHVALLRGINVGGRNRIRMADLREAFTEGGYADVATYIASGNVLFSSGEDRGTLESGIETMLEDRYGTPIITVVRTHDELREIVDEAPTDGFGDDAHHSDVVFLKDPLNPAGAMDAVDLREGVDQVWPGTGVLYFARLSSRRTQSKMSKIVGKPEYQMMTIRNWSTTTRLLALLDERA